MLHRKDAVTMAVVGLLASCGLAMADTTGISAPALSLEPTVVTAQDAGPPSGLIMQGLDKVGMAKPLQNLGINIYGWVEAGYETNLRNNDTGLGARQGAFTMEPGNHFALNQVALRIEKLVDPKKFDVGGLIDMFVGDDAAADRSNDLTFTGDRGSHFQSFGPNPGSTPQFDLTQLYVDVNIPVGNGLKIRAGKFVTLFGTETIDPRGNAFYTHSYLFSSIPFTQTGVMAFYNLNDQWAVAGGITRGWDQSTNDNNGAPDFLGQMTFTPNKQWQFILTTGFGPENEDDNSHYRTTINPIVVWQATEKLKLSAEGLYVYDGGVNGEENSTRHAYGDNYGVALYGSYVINDYLTANARAEWSHSLNDSFPFGDISEAFNPDNGPPSINVWAITVGVSIKPMPKDPIGQNLTIRPEIRYDFSEDHIFTAGDTKTFRDEWTAGADVIFTY